jgi:hypothetical protein
MEIVLVITFIVLIAFAFFIFKLKRNAKNQEDLLKKYIDAFGHMVNVGFFKSDEIESIIRHEIFHTDEDKMFEKYNLLKERVEYLYSKYGIEKGRVHFNKSYWIGMSKEELIDSLGQPVKVLNKETSKKIIVSYYYDFMIYNFDVKPYKSSNFKMKFIIENDLVTEFTNMERI